MRSRMDSSAGSLRTTFAPTVKVILSCLVAVVLVGALGFLSRATAPPSGYDVIPADSTAPADAQAVYQAANAAQSLNAYFRLTGVSLLPPAGLAEATAWDLGLDLRDFGTGEKQEPLGGAHLTPDGRRIEYLQWLNMLGVLGWWLNARVLKRERLPAFQLAAYNVLSRVVLPVESWIGPPTGLSLVAVATPGREFEPPKKS